MTLGISNYSITGKDVSDPIGNGRIHLDRAGFFLKKLHWLYFVGFASFPILATGLFVLVVTIQAQYRYDPKFFTLRYQVLYSSPSAVIEALEEAMRTNNSALYAEVIGLKKKPSSIEHNPDIRFATLLEVNDAGYFHYLFFDIKTYKRASLYTKKVLNRWVVVPQDAYFYLDSGKWLVILTPLALVWWSLLIVVELAIFIYRSAARIREDLFSGIS